MKVLRAVLSSMAVLGLLGAGLALTGCGDPADFQQPIQDEQPAEQWQPEEPAQPEPAEPAEPEPGF